MPKRIRTVRLSERQAERSGGKLWAYGVADLAHHAGVHDETVRKWIRDGRLDPGDLEALFAGKLFELRDAKTTEPDAVDVEDAPAADTGTVLAVDIDREIVAGIDITDPEHARRVLKRLLGNGET